LFELAASYAESLIRNHPFLDGNKRTALVAADVFLILNGYDLRADQKKLADMLVALAQREADRSDLAHFFKKNSQKRLF